MNLTTDKQALGIFATRQEAEQALNELRDAGFAMNQLSIIAKQGDLHAHDQGQAEARTQELTETTHVDEGAKAGAGTGAAVGGITGLLVGLGTLAIPGVGPIMLAGAAATALATTLAGTAIGTAAGGLVGGLIGLGIPEDRAHAYQERVARGDYLLMVNGTESEILQAEAILRRRGIREWEVYPSSSRTAGVAHDSTNRF